MQTLNGIQVSGKTVVRTKGNRVRFFDPNTARLSEWTPIKDYPELVKAKETTVTQNGIEEQGTLFDDGPMIRAGDAVSDFLIRENDKYMSRFWEAVEQSKTKVSKDDLLNQNHEQRINGLMKYMKAELQNLATILGIEYTTKYTKLELSYDIDGAIQRQVLTYGKEVTNG